MKISVKIFLLLMFVTNILFAQNYTLYYINNEVNSLTIDKKGNLDITSSMLNSDYIKYNLQIGYSPIKHISISIGYLNFGKKSENQKRNQLSYITSLGVYHFFEWDGYSNYGPLSNRKKIKDKKGILLNFNTGFSFNKLRHHTDNLLNLNRTKFNSHFFQLGCHYNYNRGIIGISTIFNRVNYKEISYEGYWFSLENIDKISAFIGAQKFIPVWSINLHGSFGKKPFKFIFGSTYIINAPFKSLGVSSKRDSDVSYIGVSVDMEKVINLLKTKKRN